MSKFWPDVMGALREIGAAGRTFDHQRAHGD
jgi:hypothetical protein